MNKTISKFWIKKISNFDEQKCQNFELKISKFWNEHFKILNLKNSKLWIENF